MFWNLTVLITKFSNRYFFHLNPRASTLLSSHFHKVRKPLETRLYNVRIWRTCLQMIITARAFWYKYSKQISIFVCLLRFLVVGLFFLNQNLKLSATSIPGPFMRMFHIEVDWDDDITCYFIYVVVAAVDFALSSVSILSSNIGLIEGLKVINVFLRILHCL